MPPPSTAQRAQFRDTVMLRGAGGTVTLAPAGSLATLYEPGTQTPLGGPIYADPSGSSELTNPVTVGDKGELEFWLQAEREFDVEVSCTGYAPIRVPVTADSAVGGGTNAVFVDPLFIGTIYGEPAWDQPQSIVIAEPNQPFIDHRTLDELDQGNPHPQYEAAGAAAAGDANHTAASDPHSQYLTQAEGTVLYDLAGAASAGDAVHMAAGDPHSQYLTQAEADARYVLSTTPGVDSVLRAYVQGIMAILDPGGPPPPPP